MIDSAVNLPCAVRTCRRSKRRSAWTNVLFNAFQPKNNGVRPRRLITDVKMESAPAAATVGHFASKLHSTPMFETRPEFQQTVPLFFTGDGSRYWNAIAITVNLPWFVLRCRQTADVGCFIQTIAVASDLALRGILEAAESSAIVDLSTIFFEPGGDGWSLRRITEVWLASSVESEETGPLLFSVTGSTTLLSSYLQPVRQTCPDRTLLIRISSAGG